MRVNTSTAKKTMTIISYTCAGGVGGYMAGKAMSSISEEKTSPQIAQNMTLIGAIIGAIIGIIMTRDIEDSDTDISFGDIARCEIENVVSCVSGSLQGCISLAGAGAFNCFDLHAIDNT